MSSISVLNLGNLSAAILRVQSNIDHINEVTEQAITFLENKKRELRRGKDPNVSQVEVDIENITMEHDRLIAKLTEQKTDVTQRKASMALLDGAISDLDREISRIQCDRDTKIQDLERKKSYIFNRLRSIQDLNIVVHNMSAQIYAQTADFKAEMSDMEKHRQDILDDPNLTDSERALALVAIDREIAEKRQLHEDYINSLKRQREESMLKIRDLEMDSSTAYQIKIGIEDELTRLETSKIGATPSELEEINRKIKILQRQAIEIDLLRDLNERGLKMTLSGHIQTGSGRIMTVAEAVRAGLLSGMDVSQWLAKEQLKERGLEMTPSGNIRTQSGRIITLDEAMREGLLEGVNVQSLFDRDEEESTEPSISTEGTLAGLASEDVEYLKNVLGKPLALALAEICAKQPRDPIHYLGHWLFKYRYNQEIDEVRKNEINELITERERIRKETWQKQIEDAAKEVVLEMVFKAHDRALMKEFEEIARMQELMEAENEELAEEAKDTLGELGPPIGQKGP